MQKTETKLFRRFRMIEVYEHIIDVVFVFCSLYFILGIKTQGFHAISIYVVYTLLFICLNKIYQVSITKHKLKFQMILLLTTLLIINGFIMPLYIIISKSGIITFSQYFQFIVIQTFLYIVLKIIMALGLKKIVTRQVLIIIEPNDEHALYHVFHSIRYYAHIKDMRTISDYSRYLIGVDEVYNMSKTYLHHVYRDLRVINYNTVDKYTVRNVKYNQVSKSLLFMKRLGDIVFGMIGIIIFSIPMLLSIIAIKIADRGPVFYKQERYGKDLKVFKMVKFRTMDYKKQSNIRAIYKDKRITPVGRVLRALKLDELPQLFHVVSGKMSLVGPRPLMCEHVLENAKTIKNYHLRSKVKPGLTGLSQIFTRMGASEERVLKLDLVYIERMRIANDLQIIMWTIPAILMHLLIRQKKY